MSRPRSLAHEWPAARRWVLGIASTEKRERRPLEMPLSEALTLTVLYVLLAFNVVNTNGGMQGSEPLVGFLLALSFSLLTQALCRESLRIFVAAHLVGLTVVLAALFLIEPDPFGYLVVVAWTLIFSAPIFRELRRRRHGDRGHATV